MGVKSQKKAKTRLDAYYRLAKDQGFRARSAFKLIQLNRKYDFLAKSRVLVDLCAAPGGWCQVAAQTMPVGSKIIGVDLVPIAPIRGVKTFVGDITDDKTRKTIKTWLKKEPVDTVIHDGAPNVGGVWAKDLFAQNSLVLCATKIACELLKPGGWYVTKVFRSPDYQKLMWVFKQLFEKVEATKPLASRMESAEIFVTCAGFKAPRQLDPKLFQAQYVFSDVGEEKIMLPNGMMVTPKNNVPQGYEEFATIPTKIVTLTEFLDSTEAKTLLTTQHEIRAVTDEEKSLMKSRWAKPELIFLMYDLQQVGDADRRRLLRLRDQLVRERARRRLAEQEAALNSDAAPEEAPEEELEIDDEEELDDMARQLLAIKRQEEREQKKKAKKVIDRKLKQVRGLINFNPNEASANAPDMFGQGEDGAQDAADDGFVDPLEQKQSKKMQQRLARAGGYAYDDDDEDYEGDFDEDEDGSDDDDEDELSPIEQLGKYSEEELAIALDKYAEDHIDNDRGKHLPNIPLNSINDVHLDPDDDMDNADVLHDSDEEGDDAANAGAKRDAGAKKKGVSFLNEDDESDFDPDDFILNEDEDGLLDVDETGNYVRSKDPVLMEKFRVQSESKKPSKFQSAKEQAMKLKEDAAAREQEKKDKREAKLDEVGKKSKWERRHLNVDQILRDTFAKPKQQKDPKKRARLEEDLIEMGDDDEDVDQDAAVASKKKKQQKKAVTDKFRLHDESDASDDDEDADEDDDNIGDLQKELHKDDDDDDYLNDDDLVGDVDEDMEDQDAAHLARRMLRPDAVRGDKKNKFVPKQGELTAQEQAKALRKQVERENRKNKSKKTKAKDAFEEIPIALTDPTVRARTLALATKMLDKKTRMQTLDSSVHRYMIDDDEDLPDWFVEDEQKHYQLNLPVTADEMAQQRARFQELNSRPSKRVMEAVGRKHKKAQRMLRGMLEKGKTDPTMRNKAQNLSVRKLMRSKSVKGGASAGKKLTRREERNNDKRKKMTKYDGRTKGEQKREWDKKKRAKKSGKGRR